MKCVEVLDKEPSVVLCHSEVLFIDDSGQFIKAYDSRLHNIGSPEPHLRFSDLIRTDHWCFDVFGLIRSDALRQTPLIGTYAASDRNTLAALSLLGRFYRIPEHMFYSRDHIDRSIRKFPDPSYRLEWFDPKKQHAVAFPYWRIFLEYIKDINRVQISPTQYIKCYFHLLRWLKTNLRFLKRDITVGVKIIANNHLRPKF